MRHTGTRATMCLYGMISLMISCFYFSYATAQDKAAVIPIIDEKIIEKENFAPVEKTGQTTSNTAGDDGDLKKGVPWPSPRFTDNANGTVKDKLTGLIWLKNANCFGARQWFDAVDDCNSLASPSCGLSDGSRTGNWRLPNVKELQSLIHFGNQAPALSNGHPFLNVQLSYWSSSEWWDSTDDAAWRMSMWYGITDAYSRSGSFNVWPVRGGN